MKQVNSPRISLDMARSDVPHMSSRKSCGVRKPQRICHLYIFAFLGSIAVLFVTPIEAGISTSSSKTAITFNVMARELGLRQKDLEAAAVVPLAGRGRRNRRSAMSREYIEFRKFWHKMQQLRKGANVHDPQLSGRDTLLNRASMGYAVAKEIQCGQCRLKKEWIPVSKPGCRTNFVLAPVCTGMCETWEIPDVNPPYVTKFHRVCRPKQIEYRVINLQRCKPGVNTQHTIPIAKSCACLKCKSTNTACRLL